MFYEHVAIASVTRAVHDELGVWPLHMTALVLTVDFRVN